MSNRLNILKLRKELDELCWAQPGQAGKLAAKRPTLGSREDSAAPWFAWVNDVGSIFRRASNLVCKSEKHKDTLIRRAVMTIKELADEANRAYKTIGQLEDLVKRLQKDLEAERRQSSDLKRQLEDSRSRSTPIREYVDPTQKIVEIITNPDV